MEELAGGLDEDASEASVHFSWRDAVPTMLDFAKSFPVAGDEEEEEDEGAPNIGRLRSKRVISRRSASCSTAASPRSLSSSSSSPGSSAIILASSSTTTSSHSTVSSCTSSASSLTWSPSSSCGNLPYPPEQPTVTIGLRLAPSQSAQPTGNTREWGQRRSLSGRAVASGYGQPPRKRTLSEHTPRRVFLSSEEEEKRKREDKERRKDKGDKERRKDKRDKKRCSKEERDKKRWSKEERARAKRNAEVTDKLQEPTKGAKEESKQTCEDGKLEAVVAGGAGWKEHLQNLWEEDFVTSFRSATTLADSSPFTSPLKTTSGPTESETTRRLEAQASLWALEALAAPVNREYELEIWSSTFSSSLFRSTRDGEDEEGSMVAGAGKPLTPRSAEPDDDWRDMLRQGWREELSRMDKNKASLLQPKALAFDDASSKKGKKKAKKEKDPATQRKKVRTKLKRYKSSLKAALNQSTATMKDLRNGARAVKLGAKEELAKYVHWRRPALKRIARQLIHLRLARFDLLERVEERKIALVAARIDATKAYAQRWKEGETLSAQDRSIFLEPEVLFIQDERMANLRLRLTMLNQQRRMLAAMYDQKVNQALEDTDQSRTHRLRKLLASVESNPRGFHPLDDQQQSAFDSLLLDQRFKEGRRVERLQMAMVESVGNFKPDDILSFLASLVSDMVQDHQLNESEHQKLRLFVSRTVFPLIHHLIYPSPDPADDVYVVQANIFAALPPSALHIPPENYKENSDYPNLYTAPSDKLNDLFFATVPTDALNTLVEVMNLISEEAKARSGASSVGADDILPLLQLALVRSFLFDVHRLARFIEDWSYESEKHGEYGWSLTTFSAAAQHISAIRPSATGSRRRRRHTSESVADGKNEGLRQSPA